MVNIFTFEMYLIFYRMRAYTSKFIHSFCLRESKCKRLSHCKQIGSNVIIIVFFFVFEVVTNNRIVENKLIFNIQHHTFPYALSTLHNTYFMQN